MKRAVLSIGGMTCSACSNGLEKYLKKQKGIITVSVNLVMASCFVEYDENLISRNVIDTYISRAGFKSLGTYRGPAENRHSAAQTVLTAVYGILLLFMMYVSMAPLLKLPQISVLSKETHPLNYAVFSCALAVLFLIYGFDILKNGVKNFIHLTPNMDTLVTVGVSAAFIYSLYGTYLLCSGKSADASVLFFESCMGVIYFIKLGRKAESYGLSATLDAIRTLVKITPNTALRKTGDGGTEEVTLDDVAKGDILVCRPGDKAATDGEIVYGEAHFDESFITGESVPVKKTCGSKIVAGSLDYDGYAEYRAERIGRDSTVSKIVELVSRASSQKAPAAQLADKISSYFVPAVIAMAVLTAAIYLLLGYGTGSALKHFVTVLTVACPCSLGLAAPIALVTGEGLCAGNGILVKKSRVLQNAGKTEVAVFDKTGTLTEGRLNIKQHKDYCGDTEENIRLFASLEAASSHPISRAFVTYAEQNGIKLMNVKDFVSVSGKGISGTVDGKALVMGSAEMMAENDIVIESGADADTMSASGCSTVYAAQDGRLCALYGVRDTVRPGCADDIKALKDMGIRVIMLSGDNEGAARRIAAETGIEEVIAGVLPEDKAKKIESLSRDSTVLMCGDGINDSPALAMADVGVSISGASDIAKNSADVILTQNTLRGVGKLIRISCHVSANIKQNLFWAFFYNILMLPIAAGLLEPYGMTLDPMTASIAMVLSSITVVLNALRLKLIKP